MYKDIIRREFIGLYIKVIDSKNKGLVGLEGKIIDETKNMLTIECDGKQKKLIKDQVKMLVQINNKEIEIDGKLLVGRPEDRIKK